jgi:amino acid transporter
MSSPESDERGTDPAAAGPEADKPQLPQRSESQAAPEQANGRARDVHGTHTNVEAPELPGMTSEVAGVGEAVGSGPHPESRGLRGRIKTLLIGRPRDLGDQSLFHSISLIALLAWVGLGADGLSSSAYGPPEAFANLGQHSYLAVFLALAIVVTVFVISACYSQLIEDFPSGGGGYLVASKLLGPRMGVLAGSALLVDYVMTITVSIAAAGDALVGLAGPGWADLKLPGEFLAIVALIVLNLRGVKESVKVLLPIFVVFLVSHAVLIFGTIGMHLPDTARVAGDIAAKLRAGANNPELGILGMLALLLHAYSLGAGTYTGIEAVSNSMQVMREPRVATAKRTMVYMAVSLAITAGGLIVAYLLLGIQPVPTKTLNHVLTERFTQEIGVGWLGGAFVFITLLSEGALLIVAAQAGFIGGPRGLANMAQDSWLPRWFANLSERLVVHNGILLMGGAALVALVYTHGDVSVLVVMYAINVFVTFSLSMLGMCRHWYALRGRHPLWRRRLTMFVCGAVLCLAILGVTIWEKFDEGAWRTIVVTGGLVAACLFVNRYYREVGAKLRKLDQTLGQLVTTGEPNPAEPEPSQPTAVILVGGYSGLGIHTLLNAVRFAPDHFQNFVFISAAVVDSGNFKGTEAVDDLIAHTEDSLGRYVELGQRLGVASTSGMAVGTDAVDALERLCLDVARRFPKSVVFAGQLVFQKDTWLHRLLHNQTAYSLQRRLQWAGIPMVILPTRVR